MKIAVFTEGLGHGGVSSYCLELAAALQEIPSVRAYLVALNDNRHQWLRDEARRRGLTLHEIEVSGPFDWSSVRKIHTFLTENEIDIAHTQAYKLNLLVRLCKMLHRTRAKLVNTVHGVYAFRTATLASRVYYILDYATFWMSGRVIAVSSTTARQLATWHVPRAKKCAVIPNGVNRPPLRSTKMVEALGSQLGITASDHTVGFVGRLSPEKGIDWLCEISRLLVDREPACQVLILGDGPLRQLTEGLRDSLPNNVKYVGQQHDVHSYLDLMRVLVVPSRTEGMPMAIIEAFAHGIPVVAANVGGVPEIVTDGVTGVLCEYGDSAAMVEGILGLLSDENLRMKMSAQCLAQYSQQYSCRLMAERTLDVYQNAITRSG